MKQLLSALMDGELESPAAEKALDGLGKSGELRRDWAVYHLIGDHLRGDPACCLSSRFSMRLASEATVFVPPASRNFFPSSPSSPSASAAVAALLGVLVVAWAAVSLEMKSSGALPEAVARPVEFRQVAIGGSLQSPYAPLHRVASRSNGGRAVIAPAEVVSRPGVDGGLER